MIKIVNYEDIGNAFFLVRNYNRDRVNTYVEMDVHSEGGYAPYGEIRLYTEKGKRLEEAEWTTLEDVEEFLKTAGETDDSMEQTGFEMDYDFWERMNETASLNGILR